MLRIINISSPIQEHGISLKAHKHTVTILNTETGVTFEEVSGPAEPLEGKTSVSLIEHRHNTSAGYTDQTKAR